MKRFVEGTDRGQSTLLPDCLVNPNQRSALAKDPISCALMSGLFLRRLPLAIMGVRLRFSHQIYIACSRHKSFNGIA